VDRSLGLCSGLFNIISNALDTKTIAGSIENTDAYNEKYKKMYFK